MTPSKYRKVTERESKYARGAFAMLVNHLPGMYWHPNTNWGNGFYTSGLPDGEIRLCGGHIICAEFKAAKADNLAALYLGNPCDPVDSAGWTVKQRTYWRKYLEPYRIPLFLVAWVYAESHIPERTNILVEKSNLFVVPPEAWLALEEKAAGQTMTVGLTPATARFKEFGLLDEWAAFRLDVVDSCYIVPASHILMQTIQQFN
mgnify:CR=1 FL=1